MLKRPDWNLPLNKNRSRSTQVHRLNKIYRPKSSMLHSRFQGHKTYVHKKVVTINGHAHSLPTYSRPNRKLQSLYVGNQLAALHLPVLTQWTRVYKHLFLIRNIFNLSVRHTPFHICYHFFNHLPVISIHEYDSTVESVIFFIFVWGQQCIFAFLLFGSHYL